MEHADLSGIIITLPETCKSLFDDDTLRNFISIIEKTINSEYKK